MNFDRIAPFYNAMETWFAGRCLQRCRVAFLEQIPTPSQTLMVGEGHGRFLLPFRRRFPEAQVVVIDGSARMLEIAKTTLLEEGLQTEGIRFVHAMIEEWRESDRKFDLIVTNFVLDCLTADQLDAIVSNLGSMAKEDAHWLVADFEIAERGAAKWRSRIILGLLYRFFRMTANLEARSLVAPEKALAGAGFRRVKRKTWEWGLLKSEWWRRTM